MFIKKNIKDIKFKIKKTIFYFKLNFQPNSYNLSYERNSFFSNTIKKNLKEGNTIIPKIIWIYWHDEVVPNNINIFINRIKVENKSYEINVLNKITIKEFLPNLDFKIKLRPAHESDLIRLELLYKFGGVWLDSSIILNEGIDWVNNIAEKNKIDCIAFYRKKSSTDLNNPIVETWFLAAPKRNVFIGKWLEILRKIQYIGTYNLYLEYKKRRDYLHLKQSIEDPFYLITNIICQGVMRDINPSLYLLESEKSAFYYSEKLGWKKEKLMNLYCIKDKPDCSPRIVKITSGERLYLNEIIKKNKVNKKSIIGEMLNEII